MKDHADPGTIDAFGGQTFGFIFSIGQLRSIIERIERLEEEKREIAEQIKEVHAEAKADGFDTKTIKAVVALRRKKPEQRAEEEAMLDLYLDALGMLPR